MERIAIIVRASWDEEASVWVATSGDIRGLAAEAATMEELREKVLDMLSDLIELNGIKYDLPEIPVHILAEQSARLRNPIAA